MASRELVINYAQYVIGEVESGWNWAAVYRSDPITIGMMQNYGWNAAQCILACKEADPEGWEAFKSSAPYLAEAVEANHDWNWWTGYYVNDEEAAAWQTWAERDGNHLGQQKWWEQMAGQYVDTLLSWGFSLDRPQVLVYAMSMYHQSPASCSDVVGSCSASADLQLIHTTCLNNGVFSSYPNRYNTVYERLSAWDGNSEPPDFGQVETGGGGGQNEGGISQLQSVISRIEWQNGQLVVYGTSGMENGLVCERTSIGLWIPSTNSNGTPIEGGTTGGGSATGSEAQKQICQWLLDHVDAFYYTQGAAARLDPIASGGTDCSGLMYYVFQLVTGQNIGTWTGDQVGKGELIAEGSGSLPQGEMQPADLVFFNWSGYNPTYNHVECYLGNNQLIGHGGPGNGPYVKENADAYASDASDWMVRRYVN